MEVFGFASSGAKGLASSWTLEAGIAILCANGLELAGMWIGHLDARCPGVLLMRAESSDVFLQMAFFD